MKYLFSLTVFILLAFSARAQTRVVHGELKAFDTYPVENVEVVSRKGKSATMSDSLGRFSLVCMEDDVIKVRAKTFQPVSKKVDRQTDTLKINLIFIDNQKNREVAIGYGYVKKDDLMYAVDHLQQENNEFCIYNNVFEVIVGRFPGVDVQNHTVVIRGNKSFVASNEALYVVDGVPVNSIDWVNPCQIKSISVLKDASAAMYGSRGANGVVLIELIKTN